jgi:ionotropic glutamate receptor
MRNAVYFVFGSWCLGAMILGCAYNSVLTSYILGSNAEQLVNSLTDLARKSNVHLVVDKGSAVESVLLVIKSFYPKISIGISWINFEYYNVIHDTNQAANDGLFKQLGDKLRTQPLSYCTKRQDCIDLVKSGSYAYLQVVLQHVIMFLKANFSKDFSDLTYRVCL